MTKNKTGLSFLWLSAVAFILDLLTKYIVVQRFDLCVTMAQRLAF